jgi:TonB family protein
MYFDFEDHRPDISPVGSAISWREGVLLSIILHLLGVIVLLAAPDWLSMVAPERNDDVVEMRQRPPDESPRFVFVQPRIDTPAEKPPPRAELSDQDRQARQLERPQVPTNPLPFSRGNSPERVEFADERAAKGQGPQPEPAPEAVPETSTPSGPPLAESQTALNLPTNPPTESTRNRGLARGPVGGGRLGDALRNLDRYMQSEQFENPGGDAGSFGPAIQFDTKGVEFGPWIRRFIAQVKRNWLIPYAAMSMKGRVVVTFNVHKSGAISDLIVVGPSPVDAFNNAAYGALASSNPTQPLPPEYPVDKAFFTVTFFYNEQPQ